jgi:hypothetical protein
MNAFPLLSLFAFLLLLPILFGELMPTSLVNFAMSARATPFAWSRLWAYMPERLADLRRRVGVRGPGRDRSGLARQICASYEALFTLPRTMDRYAVRNAARKAGVDLGQLDRDLSARSAEIDRILGKTDVEARTLQLQGTLGFVIGHNLVPGALSLEHLEHLVAKAKDKK